MSPDLYPVLCHNVNFLVRRNLACLSRESGNPGFSFVPGFRLALASAWGWSASGASLAGMTTQLLFRTRRPTRNHARGSA